MIEQKIKELGYEIPEVPKPLAAYIPALMDGKNIYTSGQVPLMEGKLKYEGKVGKSVNLEEAKKAAEICTINCLSAVKSVIGSLDNVDRILKVTVYVNSANDFYDQPKVANGASELLGKIFGDSGMHVRAAVGVNSLPINAPVEIEMVVKSK
jgi:enamine deaminase RidA (YjgF/YER057c/UK114 family)